MFFTKRIANPMKPTLVALVLSLVAHGVTPLPAAAQREAPGRVLKPSPPPQPPAMGAPQPALPSATIFRAEQLTKQQFKALPDSAVIESKGQRLTKAQIRARAAERHKEWSARMQAAANQAQAQFEQRRAQFEQEQQAKLQADNAKAKAEFARLRQASGPARSPQHKAIEQEAAQLFSRSKTASPADRAQIEQRAGELLKQLQQLPR